MTSPRPVADLDDTLRSALRGYHRSRWITLAAVTLLLAAAVIVLGVLYLQQDARLRASCEFWLALTPLPVTIVPPNTKPTPVSVNLIAGSRVAYAGQGCGRMPPAAPSLVKWAHFYGIRLP